MTVAWAALLLLVGAAMLGGAPVPPLELEDCGGEPQVCVTRSPGLPVPGLIAIGIGTWCMVAGLALVRRRGWARRAVVVTLLVLATTASLAQAMTVVFFVSQGTSRPLHPEDVPILAIVSGTLLPLVGYLVTALNLARRSNRPAGADTPAAATADHPG